MSILAGDADEGVRAVLTGHPALSHDVLLKLCDDPSPLVAEKAKNLLYKQSKRAIVNQQEKGSGEQQISLPESALATADHLPIRGTLTEPEQIENEFDHIVAKRATTPPRKLAELAKHADGIIRGLVAANPNATPEILWQLADDKAIGVRKKLLTNYNCPKEIIDYLTNK